MFKKLAAIASISAIALLGLSAPVSATATLTGTAPAPATENQTVPLSFTLAGVEWDDVLVTLTVVDGGLTVDLDGDSAPSAGYDLSDATASTQSFYGTAEAVAAVLANGIEWHTPSTAGTYNINFSLQVREYVSGLSYNPDNGHFYLVPQDGAEPEELTAIAAFAAANNGDYVYAGLTGYIAEINDAAENEFVAEYSGGENIWIGGTAEHTLIDLYTEAGYSSDSDWVWVYSWENFADGLDPAVPNNGAFTQFADGEPNNGNANEGCLVTNVGGDLGYWNDLPCDWTNPYIVEFEPVDGVAPEVLVLTDEDIVTLAKTGVDANGIALTAGLIGLAGAVAVAYRRRRA